MSPSEEHQRSWSEPLVVAVLGVSLVAIALVWSTRRPAPPRAIPPMAVYTSPVADSVWHSLLQGGHATGGRHATDTLVVFSDYECPICAAVAPLLDSLLLMRAHVAVLHRHFPLPSHPHAFDEALVVECAARLGRLVEGQDAMYAKSGTPVDPAEVARELGLAPTRFEECWQGADARSAVESDFALAMALDLPGTPSVFFAGRRWSHFPDPEQLLRLTEQTAEGGRALPAR
jgi:protein-disulfide isomerase